MHGNYWYIHTRGYIITPSNYQKEEVPILRRYKKPEPKKFYPRNYQIRSNQVRVIGEDGEQLGILSLSDAVAKAQAAGLDLVAVSMNSNPPVARITEFAKFLYDQKQREKRQRKNTKEVEVKELRFGPNIGDHDLEIRIQRAKNFLKAGNKIKINCQFRGRMITHPEVGKAKINRMLAELEDLCDVERGPYHEGRSVIALLQPKK